MSGTDILLSLIAAVACGLLLDRLRVPAGMMIGALLGASVYGMAFGRVMLPGEFKTVAQIIAGAYIGATVTRNEAKQMRFVIKPAITVIIGLMLINLIAGTLITFSSDLSPLTAMLGAMPGGMSEMPMIAADMGGDPVVVMIMQFARFLMGIALFPMLIKRLIPHEGQTETVTGARATAGTAVPKHNLLPTVLTLGVAVVCGLIGKWLDVPAGTMALAMLGTMIFKLLYEPAVVPSSIRKVAQCLSGAYVGVGIGLAELATFGRLALPIFILIASYSVGCYAIGRMLHRCCSFTMREAMLGATPAGASDMALISADLGVHSMRVMVLQVIRLITVITLFPSIFSFFSKLLS